MARLTTHLGIESLKIQRSGFNFKSHLTSAIGNLANCDIQQDMFPAIMPWSMTLVSRNAAVRRENHAEENLYKEKN